MIMSFETRLAEDKECLYERLETRNILAAIRLERLSMKATRRDEVALVYTMFVVLGMGRGV